MNVLQAEPAEDKPERKNKVVREGLSSMQSYVKQNSVLSPEAPSPYRAVRIEGWTPHRNNTANTASEGSPATITASEGSPVTINAGGGYPATINAGGGYPVTIPAGGGYPATIPAGGGYPATIIAGGGYPVTIPAVVGYPATINAGGGYPATIPAVVGYPSASSVYKVADELELFEDSFDRSSTIITPHEDLFTKGKYQYMKHQI